MRRWIPTRSSTPCNRRPRTGSKSKRPLRTHPCPPPSSSGRSESPPEERENPLAVGGFLLPEIHHPSCLVNLPLTPGKFCVNICVHSRRGKYVQMPRVHISKEDLIAWAAAAAERRKAQDAYIPPKVQKEEAVKARAFIRSLRQVKTVRTNFRYGLVKTGLYRSWRAMIHRCYYTSNSNYKHYGAKGIRVAPEWFDFNIFGRDMGANWEPGLTLDRIDPTKGYCKDNCRWLSKADNTKHSWTTSQNSLRYKANRTA